MREVDVRTAFAFAGAVHVGAAEDGEEIGRFGKGVVRELHGAGAGRLAGE